MRGVNFSFFDRTRSSRAAARSSGVSDSVERSFSNACFTSANSCSIRSVFISNLSMVVVMVVTHFFLGAHKHSCGEDQVMDITYNQATLSFERFGLATG